MKKLIIAVLIFCNFSFAAQSIEHTWFAIMAINATKTFLKNINLTAIEPVALPVVAIISHVVVDRLVSESSLGAFQYDVSLLTLSAGYLAQPTQERKDVYALAAFWGAIVPDSVMKREAHPEFMQNQPMIFSHNPDNEQVMNMLILNALILFDFKIEF